MPIENVLFNIDQVKKRVTMITYHPDRDAATKDTLALAVEAPEQLARDVAEIDRRMPPSI